MKTWTIDVEVVHEDPARLAEALDPARQQAVVLLEALVDAVVDRLRLAVGVAGADDEVVRVAEHAAQVELDDVDRLLVGRVAPRSSRRGSAGLGLDELGARSCVASGARRAPLRRCSRRPRRARGSARARPAATRSRTSVDEMSMRGMSKKRIRSAAPGDTGQALQDLIAADAARARRRRARRGRGWPRARATRAANGPCRLRR